jgi:diguanylate cyclase (GGDEF)-like protein
MHREPFKLYDHIIVTKGGYIAGVVSVQKMLDAMARVQVEMAKGANPLTGLPGGVAMEREIESRSATAESISVIYIDLDHFKAYNDSYGFEAGDRMLRLLAQIMVWSARRHGNQNHFVGHIGGDDFVVVTTPEKAERVCLGVIRCFKRLVRHLYRQEDLEKGFVEVKGRDGQPAQLPLVSVSLGIVDSAGSLDLKEIGRRAAEIKRYAKSIPGSVYVRDRRKPPDSQEEFPFLAQGKEPSALSRSNPDIPQTKENLTPAA